MKFYMTSGSCSTGIHILPEELDLPFEVHIVNLIAGDQNKAGIDLSPNCLAHYRRMRGRPAVQRVPREEGYR